MSAEGDAEMAQDEVQPARSAGMTFTGHIYQPVCGAAVESGFLRRTRETCREENEGESNPLPYFSLLIGGLTALEDLLELLDPADASLAEVDLDVAGELLVDHILQYLHQTLELGALRPGAGRVVLDRYGPEFAHAGSPVLFHYLMV